MVYFQMQVNVLNIKLKIQAYLIILPVILTFNLTKDKTEAKLYKWISRLNAQIDYQDSKFGIPIMNICCSY